MLKQPRIMLSALFVFAIAVTLCRVPHPSPFFWRRVGNRQRSFPAPNATGPTAGGRGCRSFPSRRAQWKDEIAFHPAHGASPPVPDISGFNLSGMCPVRTPPRTPHPLPLRKALSSTRDCL
jgi:hypothetical protein